MQSIGLDCYNSNSNWIGKSGDARVGESQSLCHGELLRGDKFSWDWFFRRWLGSLSRCVCAGGCSKKRDVGGLSMAGVASAHPEGVEFRL